MADGELANIPTTKKLTTAELDGLKDELVTIDGQIDDKEAEKNAEAQRFAQELKPLRKERKRLLKAIQSGLQDVEVECVEQWDYRKKVVKYVDRETGKMVDQRAMDPDELQEDISTVQGGKNRGRAAAPAVTE